MTFRPDVIATKREIVKTLIGQIFMRYSNVPLRHDSSIQVAALQAVLIEAHSPAPDSR